MTMKNAAWIVAALLALAACEGEEGSNAVPTAAPPPIAASGSIAKQQEAPAELIADRPSQPGQFIARQFSFALETRPDQIEGMIAAHRQFCLDLAPQDECQLDEVNQSGEAPYESGLLRMRLAHGQLAALETLLQSQLSQEGVRLVSRVESAENLTTQVIDVEARLESLRAARAQLQALLRNAQGARLGDVAATMAELARLQGEIEAFEQTRRFLAQRTDKAAVEISYRSVPEFAPQGLWAPVERATRDFLRLMVESFAWAIRMVAIAIPILPLAFLLGWLTMVVWRRVRRR